MGCPKLAIKEVPWCVTVDNPYAPSVYQFKEYCSRRRHTICPFFRGFHKTLLSSQTTA
ncbi:MAG TPA: hypothetical protein VGB23_01340 [Nitrospirota bacterium]